VATWTLKQAKLQARAKFDFTAENDAELSFRIGDVVTIVNQDDPGWWEGELNGQRGLFPYNYVEILAKAPPPRGPAPPGPKAPAKAPAKAIPIMQSPAASAPPQQRGGPPQGQPPAGMIKAGPSAPPPKDVGPVKTGVATNVGIKVNQEAKEGKGSGTASNVKKGKVSKTKFGCVARS
jgi:hypothetical protein